MLQPPTNTAQRVVYILAGVCLGLVTLISLADYDFEVSGTELLAVVVAVLATLYCFLNAFTGKESKPVSKNTTAMLVLLAGLTFAVGVVEDVQQLDSNVYDISYRVDDISSKADLLERDVDELKWRLP